MSAGAIRRAAVIGTGTIGAGWVSTLLARGVAVAAYDPGPDSAGRLRAAVTGHWPTMRLLGAPPRPDFGLLRVLDDPATAVRDAELVQENGPEDEALKRELIAELDAAAPPGAVIASSSSGLPPSVVQAGCTRHPERVLVGHPFHPVHLIPLVEVVGGRGTGAAFTARALAVYEWLGKRPIHVRHEVAGHVANRLQAALWREAYSLVERGIATVADIDAAIAHGPGLRWSVLGPFVNQHLSGGAGGLSHTLAHLGPPMVQWWADLGTPTLTAELGAALVDGVRAELGDRADADLAAARDRVVVRLLAAKATEEALP
ncbi:3-hydroxyacyl-CoA dehydrogenase NAD-binding domain-containing protein [Dactylosporangium matsuzakiense]|uniref:3-hydroxyacyl-CoA dehydrogenase n=1 Tax=Dactylosporangium matsuzakiense TaxID=53360 RepID=A0A9W6KTX6_9ACTN|nr:3-hydroxyacyl-CoA dehydrogenase NAD-binding domain-containing protein [Dactylosporangium matsuzakiense]UWZ48524.1 L-carnitine dehydrogenase [Dactylosporangium matsuzakiense]GLL06350.1 3-hydroxyacyl-CoA dehydrogenase [Dactylosporangium matsuzakiense]